MKIHELSDLSGTTKNLMTLGDLLLILNQNLVLIYDKNFNLKNKISIPYQMDTFVFDKMVLLKSYFKNEYFIFHEGADDVVYEKIEAFDAVSYKDYIAYCKGTDVYLRKNGENITMFTWNYIAKTFGIDSPSKLLHFDDSFWISKLRGDKLKVMSLYPNFGELKEFTVSGFCNSLIYSSQYNFTYIKSTIDHKLYKIGNETIKAISSDKNKVILSENNSCRYNMYDQEARIYNKDEKLISIIKTPNIFCDLTIDNKGKNLYIAVNQENAILQLEV